MIFWGQRVKSTLNPVLHYAQVLKITWGLESWSKKIRKEKRKEVWKSLSMHALRQKVIQLWQGSFRNTFLTDKYRPTHCWRRKYSYTITIQYNDHFLNISYTINTTIMIDLVRIIKEKKTHNSNTVDTNPSFSFTHWNHFDHWIILNPVVLINAIKLL